MKIVSVIFQITDDMVLKSATITMNETGIPDSEVVTKIARAVLIDTDMNESLEIAKNIVKQTTPSLSPERTSK